MAKVYRQDRIGHAQEKVAEFIKPGSKVLEMGCATGHFTKYLKEVLKCDITAVEIDSAQADEARKYCDTMIIGNIENELFWKELGSNYDYVIYGDVLEHLTNPWAALEKTKSVMTKNGLVIASIPNIAHYKIRKMLLLGNFEYTKTGIMDDSHVRFFTKKTMKSMFEDSGYEVEKIVPIYVRKTDKRLSMFSSSAFAHQFVVAARIKD